MKRGIKLKKILSTALMVVFGFLLVACGGSGSDSDLVGTWEREHDFGTTTIIFYEDETGTWSMDSVEFAPEEFEWSTRGNTLTKEFIDYDEIEEFEYEIDGNSLTLIENGHEFIYTKVD